jgi:predicted GNAT family N-acyltransferase
VAIEVRRAVWASEGPALMRIRDEVFLVGMGVATESEQDAQDRAAHHVVAIDDTGEAIGTARLRPTGQIGRVAVLATYRSRGVGRRLLTAIVQLARELELPRVFLHADTRAIAFYEKAGFRVVGDDFFESQSGIAHRTMEQYLDIPFTPDPESRGVGIRYPVSDRDPVAEAAARRSFRFDQEIGAGEALAEVLTCARRSVAIFSPLLDHRLFERAEVIAALSSFARRALAVEARVLIADNRAILARGHELIRLQQRLPSRIRIRRSEAVRDSGMERSFVVTDGRGFWLQPDASAYQGLAESDEPVRARRLLEEFDTAYEQAIEDTELRRLNL